MRWFPSLLASAICAAAPFLGHESEARSLALDDVLRMEAMGNICLILERFL